MKKLLSMIILLGLMSCGSGGAPSPDKLDDMINPEPPVTTPTPTPPTNLYLSSFGAGWDVNYTGYRWEARSTVNNFKFVVYAFKSSPITLTKHITIHEIDSGTSAVSYNGTGNWEEAFRETERHLDLFLDWQYDISFDEIEVLVQDFDFFSNTSSATLTKTSSDTSSTSEALTALLNTGDMVRQDYGHPNEKTYKTCSISNSSECIYIRFDRESKSFIVWGHGTVDAIAGKWSLNDEGDEITWSIFKSK